MTPSAAAERAERFDEIGVMDASSIFQPKVVSLVVSDSEDKGPNLMTASWWMVAGYNPFRFQLAVSHKTYTYEIIEENPEFVLAAPSVDQIDALTLAGKVSGREIDKLAHLDLETLPGKEIDVPILADATGNLECRVIDSFDFENCTYYFASVEQGYVTADGLDGRILDLDVADVLAYMGSDWVDPDARTKHRFYADLDGDDLASYPGDDVIDTLPPELRDKYAE